MRILSPLPRPLRTLLLLLLISLALAAKVDFNGLPDCAVVCISEALAVQGCADQECACKLSRNAAIISSVGPCLIENCTPDELNQSLAANEQLCGPSGNSSTSATDSATSSTSDISTATTDASHTTLSSPVGENSSNNGGSNPALQKLAIGLGVGLGLAVLILIAVGLALFVRRRRKGPKHSTGEVSLLADGREPTGVRTRHELDGSQAFSLEMSTDISHKGTPRLGEVVDGNRSIRSELPG